MSSSFRAIPSVDAILTDPRMQRLVDGYSRPAVVELVRSTLEDARQRIANGLAAPPLPELLSGIEAAAARLWRAWPGTVINATGVVLHTNLGRAPLSRESIEATERAAAGYSDLELDLETGRRGSRQGAVSRLVCQLTGAEAALVVNNNASAVLLGLAAVASGGEVIVSRSEAVEIGGGFRIPDVLRQSGAGLVEVGTTNRTYVEDYANAITERTRAILTVHASNFRILGFTHAPALAELVELGAARGIPVLHDLGSGCLLETTAFGLGHEPMPQESVRAGATLAFFSGDKLLGGPQAGIAAGKQDAVAALSRHPLARAVRIDKLSMAALTATLLHYIMGEATRKVPVWRMIAAPEAELLARARAWQRAVGRDCQVVKAESAIGGGSLPGETMPTWALSVDAAESEGGAAELARRLRAGSPPVVGRVAGERVLLDPRTVLPGQDEALVSALASALAGA